ncbi:sulfur carrier protein ThiS [Terriglobus roseus]|uniref:Thiazole synthase/sulfur carrier protein n=1 Tax=Terriglobus roseus TaxID=392734 RepID=A0A1G7J142_9BACT|nr:sulfur carrier protein ThiS [Terriglobus roseus]SDF18596.1 thiazole synthase/sulfur carrier protein [Terriglobus roseus]
MSEPIVVTLNGSERHLTELGQQPTVAELIAFLGFRADRVALERNGDIVPRSTWADTHLITGDRIELVHFVGGGC